MFAQYPAATCSLSTQPARYSGVSAERLQQLLAEKDRLIQELRERISDLDRDNANLKAQAFAKDAGGKCEEDKFREKWLMKFLALQKRHVESEEALKSLQSELQQTAEQAQEKEVLLRQQTGEEISTLRSISGAVEKVLQMISRFCGAAPSRPQSSVQKTREKRTVATTTPMKKAKKPVPSIKVVEEYNTDKLQQDKDKENSSRNANSTGRKTQHDRSCNNSEDHDTDKELLDLEEPNDPPTSASSEIQTKRKMLLMTQESIKDILNKHTRASVKKPRAPTASLNPRMTIVDSSFDRKLSDPNYLQIYKQMLTTYYTDNSPSVTGAPCYQGKILREGLERVKRDIDLRIGSLEEIFHENSSIKVKPRSKPRKGSTPGRVGSNKKPRKAVNTSAVGIQDIQSLSKVFADDEMLSITEKEMLAYALLHSSSQSRRNDVSLGDLTNVRASSRIMPGTPTGTSKMSRTLNLSSGNQGSVLNNARLDSIKEEDDMAMQEEKMCFVRVGHLQRPRSSLATIDRHGPTDEAEVGDEGEEGELAPATARSIPTNNNVSDILKSNANQQESLDERNLYDCILGGMNGRTEPNLITPIKAQAADLTSSLCHEMQSAQRDSSAKKKGATLFCLQSSPIEPNRIVTGENDNLDLSFASGIIKQIESREEGKSLCPSARKPKKPSSPESLLKMRKADSAAVINTTAGLKPPEEGKRSARTQGTQGSDKKSIMTASTVGSSAASSARGKKQGAASFCCGAFKCKSAGK